jgi:hypothetical protein
LKVNEFKAFLAELARFHESAGDHGAAKALRKLGELFDGASQQDVAKFVGEVRVALGQ